MSREETMAILEKIDVGIHMAVDRLVRVSKESNKDLVISKDGRIVRVSARALPAK